MAVPGIKYDEGSGINSHYAINCFPVRNILQQSEDGGGAWKVEYRELELRRFNACLVTKPSAYKGTSHTIKDVAHESAETEGNLLDGFFLLTHCCVEDPTDICSVNMSNENLRFASKDDFDLFDNVAYINAGENCLSLETYKTFPVLRELEIPFCELTTTTINHGDFQNLVLLDLSYNRMSPGCLTELGKLRKLKVLHLTSNELSTLPDDLSKPIEDENGLMLPFPCLEVLMLDYNNLSNPSTFTQLAGLRKLQHLNLEKNQLQWVPHLKLVDGAIQGLISSKMYQGPTDIPAVPNTSEMDASGLIPHNTDLTPGHTIDDMGVDGVGLGGNQDSLLQSTIVGGEERGEVQGIVGSMGQQMTGEGGDTETVHPRGTTLFDTFPEFMNEDFDVAEEVEDPSLTPRSKFREEVIRDVPPPFSELRFINLAHNSFEREESLLAVAVWPSLADIDIHGNPFVHHHAGDPPLLTQFLHKRLGINLFRTAPSKPTKQPIKVHHKKSRTVSSYVPTVTKPSLEERMMLEFPPPSFKQSSPLPPIRSMSEHSSLSPNAIHSLERGSVSAHSGFFNRQNNAVNPEAVNPEAVDAKADVIGQESDSVDPMRTGDARDGDAFFVTQDENQEPYPSGRNSEIDSQKESSDDTTTPSLHDVTSNNNKDATRNNNKSRSTSETSHTAVPPNQNMSDRYTGYEELLDIDDSLDDMDVPQDLPSNVRALKYALSHQLVYRDSAVSLTKVAKAYKPKVKEQPVSYDPQTDTKEQKIEDILKELRYRKNYTDTSLSTLKQDRKHNKMPFSEAVRLLRAIENRYNVARVDSSKSLQEARKIIQESLENVAQVNKVAGDT